MKERRQNAVGRKRACSVRLAGGCMKKFYRQCDDAMDEKYIPILYMGYGRGIPYQ